MTVLIDAEAQHMITLLRRLEAALMTSAAPGTLTLTQMTAQLASGLEEYLRWPDPVRDTTGAEVISRARPLMTGLLQLAEERGLPLSALRSDPLGAQA